MLKSIFDAVMERRSRDLLAWTLLVVGFLAVALLLAGLPAR